MMKIRSPLTIFSSAMTTAACLIMIFSNTSSKAQYMPNRVLEEQGSYSSPPPLRKFELIIKNRTYMNVDRVVARSVTMTNFSVQLLPNPIRPGRQGLVNLIDGKGSCEWTIVATLDDGSTRKFGSNVCNRNDWVISD